MSHCPCCWLNPFCPPFLDKPRGRYRNPAVLVGSTFLVVNSHFWVDKPVDKGCPMLSHSKNQWYPLILDEAGSRLEFYPAFCCGMWPFEREAKRQGHDPWTGGESHGTATDGLVIFSHIYIYMYVYIYICRWFGEPFLRFHATSEKTWILRTENQRHNEVQRSNIPGFKLGLRISTYGSRESVAPQNCWDFPTDGNIRPHTSFPKSLIFVAKNWLVPMGVAWVLLKCNMSPKQ